MISHNPRFLETSFGVAEGERPDAAERVSANAVCFFRDQYIIFMCSNVTQMNGKPRPIPRTTFIMYTPLRFDDEKKWPGRDALKVVTKSLVRAWFTRSPQSQIGRDSSYYLHFTSGNNIIIS